MSQLSFFDVDLSQSAKIELLVTVDSPSKEHIKAEKTGEKLA